MDIVTILLIVFAGLAGLIVLSYGMFLLFAWLMMKALGISKKW